VTFQANTAWEEIDPLNVLAAFGTLHIVV